MAQLLNFKHITGIWLKHSNVSASIHISKVSVLRLDVLSRLSLMDGLFQSRLGRGWTYWLHHWCTLHLSTRKGWDRTHYL